MRWAMGDGRWAMGDGRWDGFPTSVIHPVIYLSIYLSIDRYIYHHHRFADRSSLFSVTRANIEKETNFNSEVLLKEMAKFLGQDVDTLKNQIVAIVLNVYSWLLSLLPFGIGTRHTVDVIDKHFCIGISGPGGLDTLTLQSIPGSSSNLRATVGYNIPGYSGPFFSTEMSCSDIPANMVLVSNSFFSVNYADVCIRWGYVTKPYAVCI